MTSSPAVRAAAQPGDPRDVQRWMRDTDHALLDEAVPASAPPRVDPA
jgi:hypothetical protein